MAATGRDRGDLRQPRYLDRYRPAEDGVVAQLAGVVASPCPDRAIVLKRQVVIVEGADGDDIGQTRNLDRRMPLVSVISGFASAMFTIDDGRGKLGGGAFSL